MALPKITQPEFEITLPVIKKKIKFRPFLVKEEKVLLIGKEGSAADQLNAMKNLLQDVVLSPKNFNAGDLTVTDLEYLFMHLRGKSVDNVVKLRYRDTEDELTYDFEVDINDVQVKFKEDRSYSIPVGELTLELRDPTMDILQNAGMSIDGVDQINENEQPDLDAVFTMLTKCLVKVYDSEQVYDDFTDEEALTFLKSIDINSFKKVQEFFDTAPRLEHTIKYKNNLGHDREVVLKGLADFF